MLEVWPRPPLPPPPPSLQRSQRNSAQHVRINRSIYRDRLPNLTWLDGRSRVWLKKKKKTTTSSLSEDDKDKREAEDQVSWMDGEVNRHKLTISHLDQLIRHELMRWQFWMLIRDSVHCLSERPLSHVRWLPPEEFSGRGRTASGLILRWLAVVNDDGIMSKRTLAITCKNVISTTP